MKTKEYFFIGLLLAICIAGHFVKYIGFAALLVAIYLISISLKRKRNGCKTACPRGVFLEKSMKLISRKRKLPKIFVKRWFGYLLLIFFFGMMVFRLLNSNGMQSASYVFVFMCSVSTSIAIVMGILSKPKSWCTICPVGNTQDIVWNKFRKHK